MKLYLIEGVSGAGKTTICEELQKRGFAAIEADEDLADWTDPKTGLPTDDHNYKHWLWDKEKFEKLLKRTKTDILFVCGGAMNKPDFLQHFSQVFTLHIDDDTLRKRLSTRTNNDFGKHPDELAVQLKFNQTTLQESKKRGTILIDATMPINSVVSEILKHIQ